MLRLRKAFTASVSRRAAVEERRFHIPRSARCTRTASPRSFFPLLERLDGQKSVSLDISLSFDPTGFVSARRKFAG